VVGLKTTALDLYENRADARGGSDDENAHCSNCGRDLGNRRADHCAGTLRRLRDRRPRIPNRAPRLCVVPRLLGTAARGELLLVPHPGLRRSRQHGRLARASSGVLLLAIRLSSVAAALTAHQRLRLLCVSYSCNAIDDACATELIRQRTTASLGAQAMSVRQRRARGRG